MSSLLLVALLVPAAAFVGWALWILYLESRHDRIPILLYHRLLRAEQARGGTVRDDEMIWVVYDSGFRAQMAHLRESGFTPIDLDDYLAIRSGTMAAPALPIVISFDDGYGCTFERAWPILRARSLTATLFVDTARLDGPRPSLRKAEIAAMAKEGLEVGSHGVTHRDLTTLDDATLRDELARSREALSELIGQNVAGFAYPYGRQTPEIRHIVREFGCRSAVLAAEHRESTVGHDTDLFAIPRIEPPHSLTLFKFRSSEAFPDLSLLLFRRS